MNLSSMIGDDPKAPEWQYFQQVLREGLYENFVLTRAYIANAQFHLDSLRQTVKDALIGVNDECLKESLLDEIVAIEINLSKALL